MRAVRARLWKPTLTEGALAALAGALHYALTEFDGKGEGSEENEGRGMDKVERKAKSEAKSGGQAQWSKEGGGVLAC